jgi:hypothetical protein
LNSYTISVPERGLRAKRKLPASSTTTQRVIDYLVSLSDPNVRRDPEVTTTALEMMRVQRSTIRRAVGGAL